MHPPDVEGTWESKEKVTEAVLQDALTEVLCSTATEGRALGKIKLPVAAQKLGRKYGSSLAACAR